MDIFSYKKNLSRIIAFFFLKFFRKKRYLRTRRRKNKLLFFFIKPKVLVRRAKFNFFQFFFLCKSDELTHYFFRQFEKSLPCQVFSYFLKTYKQPTSIFFKHIFFKNFKDVGNYVKFIQSQFMSNSPDFLEAPFSIFFLKFFKKWHRRKKFFNLFFSLKKHFFFKNVSKKTSYIKYTRIHFFPLYIKSFFIVLDFRTSTFFLKKFKINKSYKFHPLNWAMFDGYNWNSRI